MATILLILGIVLFVLLVVVHEWGHFIAARWFEVDVEEFGIGFPPRAKIVSKKNGTVYTLNWLPLGGFVRLKGEHDSDSTPGSFGAARLWQKVIILISGVTMNLIVAFLLFSLLAIVGIPRLVDNQFTVRRDTQVIKNDVLIGYIEPNSPAAQAGFKLDDRVVSINYQTVYNPTEIHQLTKSNAGQLIPITVERQGKVQIISARLRREAEVSSSQKTDNPKGYLGVVPTEYVLQRSTWSAPLVAAGLIKQFTVLTLRGIGSALANLFRGKTTAASSQVGGVISIFVLLKNGSLLGYQFILMVVAVISLTLAIINCLPFPALDGGRLFVTLLFRLFRYPLKKRTEERIHATGFVLLMVLFVLVTIVDVKRNF